MSGIWLQTQISILIKKNTTSIHLYPQYFAKDIIFSSVYTINKILNAVVMYKSNILQSLL